MKYIKLTIGKTAVNIYLNDWPECEIAKSFPEDVQEKMLEKIAVQCFLHLQNIYGNSDKQTRTYHVYIKHINVSVGDTARIQYCCTHSKREFSKPAVVDLDLNKECESQYVFRSDQPISKSELDAAKTLIPQLFGRDAEETWQAQTYTDEQSLLILNRVDAFVVKQKEVALLNISQAYPTAPDKVLHALFTKLQITKEDKPYIEFVLYGNLTTALLPVASSTDAESNYFQSAQMVTAGLEIPAAIYDDENLKNYREKHTAELFHQISVTAKSEIAALIAQEKSGFEKTALKNLPKYYIRQIVLFHYVRKNLIISLYNAALDYYRIIVAEFNAQKDSKSFLQKVKSLNDKFAGVARVDTATFALSFVNEAARVLAARPKLTGNDELSLQNFVNTVLKKCAHITSSSNTYTASYADAFECVQMRLNNFNEQSHKDPADENAEIGLLFNCIAKPGESTGLRSMLPKRLVDAASSVAFKFEDFSFMPDIDYLDNAIAKDEKSFKEKLAELKEPLDKLELRACNIALRRYKQDDPLLKGPRECIKTFADILVAVKEIKNAIAAYEQQRMDIQLQLQSVIRKIAPLEPPAMNDAKPITALKAEANLLEPDRILHDIEPALIPMQPRSARTTYQLNHDEFNQFRQHFISDEAFTTLEEQTAAAAQLKSDLLLFDAEADSILTNAHQNNDLVTNHGDFFEQLRILKANVFDQEGSFSVLNGYVVSHQEDNPAEKNWCYAQKRTECLQAYASGIQALRNFSARHADRTDLSTYFIGNSPACQDVSDKWNQDIDAKHTELLANLHECKQAYIDNLPDEQYVLEKLEASETEAINTAKSTLDAYRKDLYDLMRCNLIMNAIRNFDYWHRESSGLDDRITLAIQQNNATNNYKVPHILFTLSTLANEPACSNWDTNPEHARILLDKIHSNFMLSNNVIVRSINSGELRTFKSHIEQIYNAQQPEDIDLQNLHEFKNLLDRNKNGEVRLLTKLQRNPANVTIEHKKTFFEEHPRLKRVLIGAAIALALLAVAALIAFACAYTGGAPLIVAGAGAIIGIGGTGLMAGLSVAAAFVACAIGAGVALILDCACSLKKVTANYPKPTQSRFKQAATKRVPVKNIPTDGGGLSFSLDKRQASSAEAKQKKSRTRVVVTLGSATHHDVK